MVISCLYAEGCPLNGLHSTVINGAVKAQYFEVDVRIY